MLIDVEINVKLHANYDVCAKESPCIPGKLTVK